MTSDQKKIKLAAVGDLLLCRSPHIQESRGLEALSADILELFGSCDLVFANLECTLPGQDAVPTEPLVLSTTEQINSLADAGIDIVTLGNNHAFDCFEEGFEKTTTLLDSLGIKWFGAGHNIDEAGAPLIIKLKDVTIGFLGFVDSSSGPFRYADQINGGVFPLDVNKICESIRNLRQHVDHVVVSPHWGFERFRIPSPMQINQAHDFIDAGASMVLGHHPHVIQGLESYRGSPIAYSMGNFLANNVYWNDGRYLTWNDFERTSFVLLVELSREHILSVEQIPVFDNGKIITLEKTGYGKKCLERVNSMLQSGVTSSSFKREKLIIGKIKPILSHMCFSELKRVRLSHFKKLLKLLSG